MDLNHKLTGLTSAAPVALCMAACMIVCMIVCLAPSAAQADPPPGYYDSVDTSSPDALRESLHEVIDDHQRFPYSSSSTDTWDILEAADEDPANSANILDLYKNASYVKFGGGEGPYNREHTWPRSYGFPDNTPQNYPYTDCHHLFLCNTWYNNVRENKPFRYCHAGCQEEPTLENNGQGGGSGDYPGNSNWTTGTGTAGTWETWIGRRGDVARAIFYLDVRYEGGWHGVTGAAEPDLILTDDEALIAGSSTGDNESIAYMGMVSELYLWHLEDPVDDLERARNDVVYSYQGNRNPFIDHPEWVTALNPTAVAPALPPRIVLEQNFPNPFNPRTTISFTLGEPVSVDLSVYSVAGRRIATLLSGPQAAGRHEVTWQGRDDGGVDLASGLYFYRLDGGAVTITRRMVLLR